MKVSESGTPIAEVEKIVKNQEAESSEIYPTNLLNAPSKKIRTYLFEFLMLFLAVFCGFIADSWREKLSEHQREKIFINSIVKDIKSDTLESNKIIETLKTMNKGIDSVLIVLSSPDVMVNSNNLYRLWSNNMGLEVFVSNDRTIQQLKSSGELRLIRNISVSDRIMKYDQTLKRYYTQSNLMYSAMANMTYYSRMFDFILLNKNRNVPVLLTEEGKKSLNQAYGNMDLWNRGLTGLISWLENVNEEGKSLIFFIKKEYHLD
jgi:hypothetical protein